MFAAFLGLGLGLFELAFIALFVILLMVGTTYDRRGKEGPKWFILFVGMAALVAWYWNDWTLRGAWDIATSKAFWIPAGYYMGAGLVYSLIEYYLELRRSVRYHSDKWKQFSGSIDEFINRYGNNRPLVKLNSENGLPVPSINKKELADCVSAWTVLWPFYALSLILGDLFTEIFRSIGDFLAKISTQLVRNMYSSEFGSK